MLQKRALITGITGQDGSYLAEFLLKEDYEVFGLERRTSQRARGNIQHILEKIKIIPGDLLDQGSLVRALEVANPDEVYNLAAQSFVGESFLEPVYTGETTGLGAVRLLEVVRQVNPKIKFYQASSSEMFGATPDYPQNENSRFYPRSPYACAKAYAHFSAINYRESYGMFVSCGILFNHESPRRGLEFVTRKITHTVAKIKLGLAKELRLGNLGACRDWGFAGDYVRAMWIMLQQKESKDFVIARGQSYSVSDFVYEAFMYAGIEDYKRYLIVDENLKRPTDIADLCGDASLARRELNWRPEICLPELVAMMVDADLALLRKK